MTANWTKFLVPGVAMLALGMTGSALAQPKAANAKSIKPSFTGTEAPKDALEKRLFNLYHKTSESETDWYFNRRVCYEAGPGYDRTQTNGHITIHFNCPRPASS